MTKKNQFQKGDSHNRTKTCQIFFLFSLHWSMVAAQWSIYWNGYHGIYCSNSCVLFSLKDLLKQIHLDEFEWKQRFKEIFFLIVNKTKNYWGCPHGVMIKAMDCGIVVSKSKIQSHYYFHFWINTLSRGVKPLILILFFL